MMIGRRTSLNGRTASSEASFSELIGRKARGYGSEFYFALGLFCAAQFQLLSFVGEDAERFNAAVFRAATGPTREIVKKMALQSRVA